jgi:hypothetical protein
MNFRSSRRRVAFVTLLLTFVAPFAASVATASDALAATTTQTPVMGPSLLTAQQLAKW